ncbi:MAG TPA: type II secretion system F family protein [bacterium]|nr:type II secretion system F family protein [bacterium]
MKFNYQARTKGGEIKKGVIEASSKEAALSLLQKHDLFITYLRIVESGPFYAKEIKLFDKISKKEMVMFFRQLSIMFGARIPLVEGLRTIGGQTKSSSFREKISELANEVDAGTSFSEALLHQSKVFSSFTINIIKAGEVSGNLSRSLDYLADHYEREYYLHSEIQGAMIYPVLVLSVAVIVLALMMLFVVPQLTEVLESSGKALPLITRIVIASSVIFRKYGLILFVLFVGIFGYIIYYFKSPAGKKFLDNNVIKVPLLGQFFKMIYITRFAENLSTLVSAGIPIAQALKISGDVIGNETYKKAVFVTRDKVRRGERISQVLMRFPNLFPSVLIQMILAGEKTGTLDKILLKVVEFYQKEVDRTIKNFLSILEPIMIIFLGVIVSVIIIAILIPIYQMTDI